MKTTGRFAIVTPYYKEHPEVLKRCIESVKHQSIGTDHFVVSDGYPQDWLDSVGVRHLRLGIAHNDLGNTPRGVGALLAISEAYEGIGFLDADNWLEHDHVEQCYAAANCASEAPADLVIARRRILLPDGTLTNLPEEANHIDTSCYWLLQGAFRVVHYWLTMVPQVSAFGDRVFYRVVKANSLTMRYTESITVNYVGKYESFYLAVGKTPPPDAKPIVDIHPTFRWVMSLDHRQQQLVNQRCGIDMVAWAKEIFSHPIRRNDLCPCGSGRKYKHCHGTLTDLRRTTSLRGDEVIE
jgi:hypothetical protein